MVRHNMVPTDQDWTDAESDFHHVMTIKQAAQELSLPLHRVRYAYDHGYIIGQKWGHYVMISRSSVYNWYNRVNRLERMAKNPNSLYARKSV